MRSRRHHRRGATVLEMSIILMMFLTLTTGMLDLGLGVFRYHLVSEAARQGARRAIVHGERATALGVWGTETIDVPATANGIPIVDGTGDGLQPLLVGCNLSASRIKVEWPSGSNAYEEPVRVTVTTPYQPVLLWIFPGDLITLTGTSTMTIAH